MKRRHLHCQLLSRRRSHRRRQPNRGGQPKPTRPGLRFASQPPAESPGQPGPTSAGPPPTPATANRRNLPMAAARPGAALTPGPLERAHPTVPGRVQEHAGARVSPRAPTANTMEHTPRQVPATAADPTVLRFVRQTAQAQPGLRNPRRLHGPSATATATARRPPRSPARVRARRTFPAKTPGPTPARHARAASLLWQRVLKLGTANGTALPPVPSRGQRSADECGRRLPAGPWPKYCCSD